MSTEQRPSIMRVKFGSHLYGTSTPASDLDFKSVFIPPGREILLQRIRDTISEKRPKADGEKNAAGEVDEEAYALHKYLRLLADGQTVALDMLFSPDTAMERPPSPLWTEIVSNRHKLVSRKAASFVGYCRTQANKYGIKGSRVHAVRKVVAWFDQAIDEHGHLAKLEVASGSLEQLIATAGVEHTGIVLIPHHSRPEPFPHLECCNRKAPFFASLKDGRAIYARLLDEYGKRALQAERNEGIDWKALSHAVRVANEALEFMSTAWITFPLPNAAHILDIKQGLVPYKDVAEEIEQLLVDVEEGQLRSVLPAEPDYAYIDDLICRTYREAILAA